jgi:hypothetical protein
MNNTISYDNSGNINVQNEAQQLEKLKKIRFHQGVLSQFKDEFRREDLHLPDSGQLAIQTGLTDLLRKKYLPVRATSFQSRQQMDIANTVQKSRSVLGASSLESIGAVFEQFSPEPFRFTNN